MSIRLFDLDNGHVIPTIHCETIGYLKDIKKKYPKDYLNIYAYLFYMSCLNEDENPFANVPEDDREDIIIKEVGGKFSPDSDDIFKALQSTKKLYETPTYHLYISAKTALERMAHYLKNTPITDGRDGNIKDVRDTIRQFGELKETFNQLYREFKEEQSSTTTRGGQSLAYDQ